MSTEETKQGALWLVGVVVTVSALVIGGVHCERLKDQALTECLKTHPPLECHAAMRDR